MVLEGNEALPQQEDMLTVSETIRLWQNHLQSTFPVLLVYGEICQSTCSSLGHAYFTIKDEKAQLKCVWFRVPAFFRQITIGQCVLLIGQPGIYANRGDLQFIVRQAEIIGQGLIAYELFLLSQKMAANGWFDPARKRALPVFPTHLALITSSQGAAVHDVLTTLESRFPLVQVRIYDVVVQGEMAATEITAALALVAAEMWADVVLLVRGGGSAEDLAAFNDEKLCAAIVTHPIPICTGIGHETDESLADRCADVRAATPTAAAVAVTPNQADLQQEIAHLLRRIQQMSLWCLSQSRQRWLILTKRLHQCQQWLFPVMQDCDQYRSRLHYAMAHLIKIRQDKLQQCSQLMSKYSPQTCIATGQQRLQRQTMLLQWHLQQRLQAIQETIAHHQALLRHLSPMPTLERGYSLVRQKEHTVFRVKDVAVDELLQILMYDGHLTVKVTEIELIESADQSAAE